MSLNKIRRATLTGCVARMKSLGQKGKVRDDAALNYFIGAADAAKAAGFDINQDLLDVANGGYLAVLEALAEVGADEDKAADAAKPAEVEDDS